MTRLGEARVSPDAFETIRYVHASSLPHCRLISPMLANSAFGTVTGRLILPRNAPVGKGAETKKGERRKKTLERLRMTRNNTVHVPQAGLLSFGVLILPCITCKASRLIFVRLFFPFRTGRAFRRTRYAGEHAGCAQITLAAATRTRRALTGKARRAGRGGSLVGLSKSSGASFAGEATGLIVPIPWCARSASRGCLQTRFPGLKL